MQYTLKTARKYLRESSNAYGQNDLRDSIKIGRASCRERVCLRV